MWRYALLEIYSKDFTKKEWPKKGNPSDWIYRKQVFYSDGYEPDYWASTPLRKILWAKFKSFIVNWGEYLYYSLPWVRCRIHRQYEKLTQELKNDKKKLKKEDPKLYKKFYGKHNAKKYSKKIKRTH